MRSLLLVALFAAVAFAQQRCTSPPMWSGEVREVDYDTHFGRFANITYDATNKRFRIEEYLLEGETRAHRLEIFLHMEGKIYNATLSRDGKVESCKTEPLTFPFEPIEVPPNAEHRGQMYIGSEMAGAGVLVDVWTADTPNGHYYGAWTRVGCDPVIDSFSSGRGRNGKRVHATFHNIVGEAPAAKFIPPPECM